MFVKAGSDGAACHVSGLRRDFVCPLAQPVADNKSRRRLSYAFAVTQESQLSHRGETITKAVSLQFGGELCYCPCHGCKTETNWNANRELAESQEGNDSLSGEGIQNPVSNHVDRILSVETEHIAARDI